MVLAHGNTTGLRRWQQVCRRQVLKLRGVDATAGDNGVDTRGERPRQQVSQSFDAVALTVNADVNAAGSGDGKHSSAPQLDSGA